MKEQLIAGLDMGSSHIRLAVGQVFAHSDKREALNLIGAVEVPSQGISKGAVSSLEDAVSSISACLEQIERQIGLPVGEAYVGIGGPFVQVQLAKGVIGVSRVDGEIREEDAHRVIESARSVVNPINYEILHVLPRSFIVDGQGGIKDPVGMQGIRLEVDAHIVQGLATPVRNLTKAVFRTGLDITELVFAPLATAEAVTTPRQRELGVAVVNMGASTTTMAVYEEGELLHAAVIPIGSDHITSDIAIGLRTSLDVAERCKKAYAFASAEQVNKYEEVDLRDLGADESEAVSPRFISDIAQARVEEIFERIEKELKKIERSGMLPAGVVLTGGGVKLKGLIEVAKELLRLPVTIAAASQIATPLLEVVQDPAFSTAIGLVHWGFEGERSGRVRAGFQGIKQGGEWMKKMSSPLKKIFKSFIP
ncbi:MAG: cell division protein FtsA [Candidatus Uhrbacteria bacterium]|nr:cell division protein FtsA [Candidatus Uhrbacteria bacterium]